MQKKSNHGKVKITACISKDLHKEFKKSAKGKGVSMSSEIERLLTSLVSKTGSFFLFSFFVVWC